MVEEKAVTINDKRNKYVGNSVRTFRNEGNNRDSLSIIAAATSPAAAAPYSPNPHY
jgi:hypothetical protein